MILYSGNTSPFFDLENFKVNIPWKLKERLVLFVIL